MSSPIKPQTPRKFRSSTTSSSSCRLCGSVVDKYHSKNIFNGNNRELLILARNLSGEDLAPHENLPKLLCRPCERRLVNYKDFRSKIQESQKSFERFSKRCVEVSPSVVPPGKVLRKDSVARTKLNFTPDEKVSLTFNIGRHVYVLSFYKCHFITTTLFFPVWNLNLYAPDNTFDFRNCGRFLHQKDTIIQNTSQNITK